VNQIDDDEPTTYKRPVIGILGGMGPLAGVDFAQKLITVSAERLNVQRDQDQTPFILWSIPQIPDRTRATLDPTAPDPFPAMAAGIRGLANAGADVIVVSCNTAHYWYAKLSDCSPVPILHIADAAVSALEELSGINRVGILAGPVTLGIYEKRLTDKQYTCVVPTPAELDSMLMPAIALVKRGAIDASVSLANEIFTTLVARGAEAIILGCTELPIVFARPTAIKNVPAIDATEALAISAIRWRSKHH
jgi:aspartate racemase